NNDGYFEELQETESGIYQTKSFVGKAGSNYLLKVYYEGKTYDARSTMPANVALDTFLLAPLQLANMKVVSILPVFKDPAGEKNYYSFVRYLNGTKLKGTIIMSDELSDGKNNMQVILSSDEKLKTGDHFALELRNIDEAAHRYLSTKMLTANQNSAAPVNPLSNFSGGALGYFSTFSSQKKEAIVTDWIE
ncbi:MAG: DUF4249 family protein, partial [Bacteroidia bacterium]|nr:DUF4249 family protein [Bacteroidia bacterium]